MEVTLSHIRESYNSLSNQKYSAMFNSMSKIQKCLLLALVLDIKTKNSNFSYFSEVYNRANNIWRSQGEMTFLEKEAALEIFQLMQSIEFVTL